MRNLTPRTLLIIQVIFGSPLGEAKSFYHGEVAEIVAGDIDSRNVGKVLDLLLRDGWIRVSSAPRETSRIGRPPRYQYTRTTKGTQAYATLAQKLRRYGIRLSQ